MYVNKGEIKMKYKNSEEKEFLEEVIEALDSVTFFKRTELPTFFFPLDLLSNKALLERNGIRTGSLVTRSIRHEVTVQGEAGEVETCAKIFLNRGKEFFQIDFLVQEYIGNGLVYHYKYIEKLTRECFLIDMKDRLSVRKQLPWNTPLIDRDLRLNLPEYLVDERDSVAFENVIFGGGVVDRETQKTFKGFFDY